MPLGPWGDCCLCRLSFKFLHHLLDGVIDKALAFYVKGPGFKSRPGEWNSFKKYERLFLIEDTSELEC